MHKEVRSEKPATCPICAMELVPKDGAETSEADQHTSNSYKPLIVIISLITLVTVVLGFRDVYVQHFFLNVAMAHFMAGFFLVFSGFKLIDIQGFAKGYSSYDILASHTYSYGYVYPFIELALGLLYTMQIISTPVNVATFVVMAFSGLGVAIKLAKHEKFRCTCLGTFLKVPLTKVTLIEDFGMAAMALTMLVVK